MWVSGRKDKRQIWEKGGAGTENEQGIYGRIL